MQYEDALKVSIYAEWKASIRTSSKTTSTYRPAAAIENENFSDLRLFLNTSSLESIFERSQASEENVVQSQVSCSVAGSLRKFDSNFISMSSLMETYLDSEPNRLSINSSCSVLNVMLASARGSLSSPLKTA